MVNVVDVRYSKVKTLLTEALEVYLGFKRGKRLKSCHCIVMRNLQQIFEILIKGQNEASSFEDLKTIAIAIWYEEFIPQIDELEGKEAAQAGFILDKLSRYNCISVANKMLIRDTLLPLLEQKKHGYCYKGNVDILAKKWGANFEMKKQFKSILPYQRRTYQHKRNM